jgi:bacterioferritin-associated ferredoxin
MIVCVCRGLSERALCAVIASGANTPQRVARACGAGTDCGACGAMLKDLVRRAANPRASASALIIAGGSEREATIK